MSAVQPQEDFDVIEAISLDGEQMERVWGPQDILTTVFFLRAPLNLCLKILALVIMRKSFKPQKYFRNCSIEMVRHIKNASKRCWENQAVAWWAFCNTQTRVVHCNTKITKVCRLGIQQLAWQQGNRQTERKKQCTVKEQLPGERAHLMNLFGTAGKVCQHRTQCSFYLLTTIQRRRLQRKNKHPLQENPCSRYCHYTTFFLRYFSLFAVLPER